MKKNNEYRKCDKCKEDLNGAGIVLKQSDTRTDKKDPPKFPFKLLKDGETVHLECYIEHCVKTYLTKQ